MPTHPFVHLEEHGHSADIDVEMAGIIRQLWRLGITTIDCCQGDPSDDWNSAYISIEAYDFPRFLELTDSLLEVPAASKAADHRRNIHLGTEFLAYWAQNMREQFDGAIYHKDGEWHVAIAVRLPASFLPELRAHLEMA